MLFIILTRLSLMATMILALTSVTIYQHRQPTPESKKFTDAAVIASQALDKRTIPEATINNLGAIGNKKIESIIHPIILKAASRHQIDPALIKAIIMAESGYKIKAISKRGAKGLMQLMPETAEDLGVTDIFNPKENISGGVRYFKQLVKQFDGDIKLALAAYNAGSGKVRYYNGIPPFKATHYYIQKVFKYYNFYKNQMAVKVDKA